MFGFGLTEMIVIGVLLVLVLGPATSRRLFTSGKKLWGDYRRIRSAVRDPVGSLGLGRKNKDP
jgi:Sec-independent protein translocase protein TatA